MFKKHRHETRPVQSPATERAPSLEDLQDLNQKITKLTSEVYWGKQFKNWAAQTNGSETILIDKKHPSHNLTFNYSLEGEWTVSIRNRFINTEDEHYSYTETWETFTHPISAAPGVRTYELCRQTGKGSIRPTEEILESRVDSLPPISERYCHQLAQGLDVILSSTLTTAN